jgi:hypothetical protein
MNLGFIPDQGVARMIVKGSMPQGRSRQARSWWR